MEFITKIMNETTWNVEVDFLGVSSFQVYEQLHLISRLRQPVDNNYTAIYPHCISYFPRIHFFLSQIFRVCLNAKQICYVWQFLIHHNLTKQFQFDY